MPKNHLIKRCLERGGRATPSGVVKIKKTHMNACELESQKVTPPQILSGRTAIFLTGMAQVRCEVKGVFVATTDTATVPLVVLSAGDEWRLPIFIGLWEAVSINSAINKEVLPRPFTHDLILDLMVKFSIALQYLQIDSIENGVYYAQLVFVAHDHEEYIDCRPSDGIAVALRGNAPIFVDESVLETAGQKYGELPNIIDLSTFLQK